MTLADMPWRLVRVNRFTGRPSGNLPKSCSSTRAMGWSFVRGGAAQLALSNARATMPNIHLPAAFIGVACNVFTARCQGFWNKHCWVLGDGRLAPPAISAARGRTVLDHAARGALGAGQCQPDRFGGDLVRPPTGDHRNKHDTLAGVARFGGFTGPVAESRERVANP